MSEQALPEASSPLGLAGFQTEGRTREPQVEAQVQRLLHTPQHRVLARSPASGSQILRMGAGRDARLYAAHLEPESRTERIRKMRGI